MCLPTDLFSHFVFETDLRPVSPAADRRYRSFTSIERVVRRRPAVRVPTANSPGSQPTHAADQTAGAAAGSAAGRAEPAAAAAAAAATGCTATAEAVAAGEGSRAGFAEAAGAGLRRAGG